ncbi:molybdopterin oxidoreductase family protein [Aneurinibacillus sp. Ricciae_BoGa-3]|uniref:assimilatory nitrate reductase catalytic subunit NasC n=1 Tax=Aneurinibacillus sp. Ricciae_BoGa-3 TaxID=3022697 RepID=UPI0023412C57|nr:molybdopterin oxidoreductase family protein [Aneurinibacillus sp. Ricciae_BoGa-3]WCK55620.1 molybdopterin oxidoreductase family protein [Aneurinibacillus sp. Ricciae_BoGa-3]
MMNDLLQEFRSKQLKEETEKILDSQCPFCSMQCKMQLIESRLGDRISYKVIPAQNPTSEGRLCIKGRNAYEHAVTAERIKTPLLQVNGEFVPISWPDALHVIKEKFTAIQQQKGADAIAVYGGGSLTNEEAYLLGKFARVALQTKNMDYNGRFCMSAAASAANKAFGIDRGLTMPLADIEHAACIILAGTNIAECQPTILPYFTKAKQKGSFIIVIDPRETATARLADLHLKVKPGMDAALVNGLLKILIEERHADLSFINARTKGFEQVRDHVANIELQEIESSTGIPIGQMRQAAAKFGQAKTGMVFTARGVEQQAHGSMTVHNFINLCLVTGKIGRMGCGFGAITGQANGQGGREHGQKADQLPGYRSIENRQHREYIAKVWGVREADIPTKGVSAYELMEKIHNEQISGLFLMGSNPLVSNPNAEFVEQGLKKLEFLVVVDMFVSETAKLADLILPSSSYLEDEGTVTNLEGRVMHRPAARKPPGKSKHDWQILCEVASVFGKAQFFPYQTSEDIFNELRIASRGGIADYYGITYERIRREQGVFWPCPSPDFPGARRLFEDSFAHEDGRAVMVPVENYHPQEETNGDFPLYLTTGRVMSHYLTGVQTRRSQTLALRNTESFVEIHPSTAQKYQIENDALVRISSQRGSIVLRSKFTTKIREDVVFVPIHWGDKQNVNKLVSPNLDPTCKMPGFKMTAVNVSPV